MEEHNQPTDIVEPVVMQDFLTCADAFGEGKVNIHVGAMRALESGRATVLLSMELAKSFQRMLRLCEWSGINPEHGPFCPVCGEYHTPPFQQERAPNRGHHNDCPLRRNLDNLNRALGIPNRGRAQGPGMPLVWTQRNDATGLPPASIIAPTESTSTSSPADGQESEA